MLLVVSASDVDEVGIDVAEDPCETCEVVMALPVVEDEEEVLVPSDLIPQTFSASKVKSRFLAWHSVCWRSTDSACSPLEGFSLPSLRILTRHHICITFLGHTAEIRLTVLLLGAHTGRIIGT